MTISSGPYILGMYIVSWTGLATIASFIFSMIWLRHRSHNLGLSSAEVHRAVVRTALWALFGARFVHVVDFAEYYLQMPFQILYLWNGGMSLWGALVFGGLVAMRQANRTLVPLERFRADVTVVGLVSIALGRIGDFASGQRIGTSTAAPWGVEYINPHSASFLAGMTHPVALYEILLVGVLLIGVALCRSWGIFGKPSLIGCVGYGIGSFFIGFVTVSNEYLGLGISQWIALLSIVGISITLSHGILVGFSQRGNFGD